MAVLVTLLALCSYRDRTSVLWQAVAALLCDLRTKVGAAGGAISFGRRRQWRALFRVDTHCGNLTVNRYVVGMHERCYGAAVVEMCTRFGGGW